MSDSQIILPSSMDEAAKIAHVLGRLLDKKFFDKYLRGSWECGESMVVGNRGTWWDDRPHVDDPEMQFLLKNKMVQLYSSPIIEADCIRLLSYHMQKVEAFMKLYTERLSDCTTSKVDNVRD